MHCEKGASIADNKEHKVHTVASDCCPPPMHVLVPGYHSELVASVFSGAMT